MNDTWRPQRLVLDTNVWLDWLVFSDSGVTPLREAVVRGDAQVFINPECIAELTRVLAYNLSKVTLNVHEQVLALAQCRAISTAIDDATPSHAMARLPRCNDPDDQKFLELARDCAADALLTKDRELLALARRKIDPLPFRILTPSQF